MNEYVVELWSGHLPLSVKLMSGCVTDNKKPIVKTTKIRARNGYSRSFVDFLMGRELVPGRTRRLHLSFEGNAFVIIEDGLLFSKQIIFP